jgi:hypothetical protein
MSGACAIAHENLLFVSVPSGGKNNEQTWVLDQSPLENLLEASTAWAGVWSGFRPVQWAEGKLGGRKRLYCAAFDRTPADNTHIHIWEAMRSERNDAGGRIACQAQLAIAAAERMQVFKYAEIELVEILGDVSLTVYVGGTRGPWYQIGQFELRAEEGSIGSAIQKTLDTSSILQAFKPQARTIRTNEFSNTGLDCEPESAPNRPGKDKGFGLLLQWKGRMGIRDVRLVYAQAEESNRGGCPISEVGKTIIVTEEGTSL